MSAPAALEWPRFARSVITAALSGGDPAVPAPPTSQGHSGVFVTLHRFRQLRGCMGVLDAHMPLATAVRQAACSAALHDPRFARLQPGELPDVRIEVSILSTPRRMRDLADLELGRHGILVRRGERRGLFLPQVAPEHRLDREAFLSRCCAEKAGLPPDAWRDPATEVLLFTTEVYSEPA
jgi:AmmeMemoRadiSam system protein A